MFAELLPGGYREEEALRRIERIRDNLRLVFRISRERDVPTDVAAREIAEQRLAAARRAKGG